MSTRLSGLAVANSIRQRSTSRSVSLIIEGESDERLYGHLLRSDVVLSFAKGKGSALEALKILKASQFRGVCAIVDADHDRLLGKLTQDDNLVYTTDHDLEMMLIRAGTVRKLSHEFGQPLLRDLTFMQGLLSQATKVGALRLVSKTKDLGLQWEWLPQGLTFDPSSSSVDLNLIVSSVRPNGCPVGRDEIIREAMAELRKGYSVWQLTKGHDVCDMIAATVTSKRLSRQDIESYLRVGFDTSLFQLESLYKELQAWEVRNSPFRILK